MPQLRGSTGNRGKTIQGQLSSVVIEGICGCHYYYYYHHHYTTTLLLLLLLLLLRQQQQLLLLLLLKKHVSASAR